MVATLRGQLQQSARELYEQAVADARSHLGSSSQDRGKETGKGGARERQVFDPRDYKLPDLTSEPSMAVFKKWRHDFELFFETIGSSWKGVIALLWSSRLFEETFEKEKLRDVEALTLKHEPKAATLEFGFEETSRPTHSTSS